jgi:hypothetical protein
MPFSPRALRTVRRLTAPSVFTPDGLLSTESSKHPSLRLFFILSEGERSATLRARLTRLFRQSVGQAEISSTTTWELSSYRRGGSCPAFFKHPSLAPLTGLAANAGAS